MNAAPLGLYLRLARSVWTSCDVDDRIEVLKTACASRRIPYDAAIVRETADRLATWTPGRRLLPRTVQPTPAPVGTSHATAAAVLARLGVMLPDFPRTTGGAMRKWTKVDWPTRCGGCGVVYPAGVTVCVIESGAGWQKVRCATCLGMPAPDPSTTEPAPDLKLRADRVEAARRRAFERFTGQKLLNVWPSREPGEDG